MASNKNATKFIFWKSSDPILPQPCTGEPALSSCSIGNGKPAVKELPPIHAFVGHGSLKQNRLQPGGFWYHSDNITNGIPKNELNIIAAIAFLNLLISRTS